jgi:hypothetical protein
MKAFNQYVAVIEIDGDALNRNFVEYEAFSSSEAQAYAMEDLEENQRVISVWQRIL